MKTLTKLITIVYNLFSVMWIYCLGFGVFSLWGPHDYEFSSKIIYCFCFLFAILSFLILNVSLFSNVFFNKLKFKSITIYVILFLLNSVLIFIVPDEISSFAFWGLFSFCSETSVIYIVASLIRPECFLVISLLSAFFVFARYRKAMATNG